MKYDLTSDFLDLRPPVKGVYIYTCRDDLIFTKMVLKSNCQGRWVRGRVRYDSMREEFLVLNARGTFSLVCVFMLEGPFTQKQKSSIHSLFST